MQIQRYDKRLGTQANWLAVRFIKCPLDFTIQEKVSLLEKLSSTCFTWLWEPVFHLLKMLIKVLKYFKVTWDHPRGGVWLLPTRLLREALAKTDTVCKAGNVSSKNGIWNANGFGLKGRIESSHKRFRWEAPLIVQSSLRGDQLLCVIKRKENWKK